MTDVEQADEPHTVEVRPQRDGDSGLEDGKLVLIKDSFLSRLCTGIVFYCGWLLMIMFAIYIVLDYLVRPTSKWQGASDFSQGMGTRLPQILVSHFP
mmetsp:Transcript_49013/g.76459  ORF Transcript_49013/g.76459 Transcript_49013/m.76459 type:complete len:97 (-) Transcript_49013:698-988(-)